MFDAEFDKFAEEYRQLHAANIRITGETPEYFTEYKIADASVLVAEAGLSTDLRILDFGAGVGTSTPYFRKYFPEAHITCLDVSSRSLEVGRERFGAMAEFVHFNGRAIPYPEKTFDVAFLACVLHHVVHDNHIDLLSELLRVLNTGGILVIFEHNPYNPLTVRAVNSCAFDENAVLVKPGHLKKSVIRAGFVDPNVEYRIFFPHALRALRKLEPALSFVPLGGQYRLVAKKAD